MTARNGERSRKTRGKTPIQAPPSPADQPFLRVRDFLRQAGVDPEADEARKSAQAIPRAPWAVLGRIEKDRSMDAIADTIVVARSELRIELARDELLLDLLEQRGKYAKKIDERATIEVHSFTELVALLPDAPGREVKAMLRRRAEARRWPPRVRMLHGARDRFLVLDDRPVAADRPIDAGRPEHAGNGDSFARAFNDAFDRLRRDRPFNLVELSALRQALPGFSRDEFDRELYTLRKDSQFVLSTFEGRHGSLSPEEREAAIREDGRLFAYAARREHA